MKNIKVFKKAQTGAVLIVVLVMLILLTIAGTWAIRSGLISLNIATNSQAQSLLMQNSDSVFFTLENQTNDALKFANMRIGDGMLAYVMRPENKNKELVFCIRGTVADNFAGSRYGSIVYWNGTSISNSDMGKNGFCKTSRSLDFLSKRAAVMTQVTVRAAPNDKDWDQLISGEDKETSKGQDIQKVIITAISLLPNLSTSLESKINSCLTDYTSFYDDVAKQDTVTDCLAKNSVPYSTQDMEYTLRYINAS
ncbi:pilus assembly PilX family protein [Acinetobacter ursingii]|uniref:pilus assembly PilX family protein n=1 Tax=Acinetobacter ursingii TaxID=108980 RepID=UPI001250C518|nr:hypothetical protein [Acinetobacter ursingii]